jgi:hypothetical protein
MLRELYVAVTRAQRRVVILIQDDLPAMAQFFKELKCDFEDVGTTVFEEFDRDTSTEQWFQRAQQLYNNYNFALASSCFIRAQRQDWSFLSQARHLSDMGFKEEAEKEYRRAARVFYEGHHFKDVLKLLRRLLGKNGGFWDSADDEIFLGAINALPQCMSRLEIVQFAILRTDLSSVLVSDLKSPDVAKLLMKYRAEGWLQKLVAECSDSDRFDISGIMPMVVFDFHIGKKNYHEACRIALSAGQYSSADMATEELMKHVKKTNDLDSIVAMADMWNKDYKSRTLSSRSTSVLLKNLFYSPKLLPADVKVACMNVLGKQVVQLAVDRASLDSTILLQFSTTEFRVEVELLLLSRFGPYHLNEVVKWYVSNGYHALASQFVRDRLQNWSTYDLLRITKDFWTRPTWLFGELRQRHLLDATVSFMLLSPFVAETTKKQFLQCYHLYGPKDKGKELSVAIQGCKEGLTKVVAQMTDRQLHFEKAFTQMWMDCDVDVAVRLSWEALETHQLATANITRVLELWTELRQVKESKVAQTAQFSTTTFDDKFVFLMCLFFGDSVKEFRRVYLEVSDPFFYLMLVFGPTVATYCKMHTSMRHHDEELRLQISEFQDELRSKLQTRCRNFADDYEEGDGMDAEAIIPNETAPLATIEFPKSEEGRDIKVAETNSPNEIKPMSKSAARRLKKQQNKAKVAAAANATNNPGKNNKQSSNKNNNKKKKGKK